MKTTDDRLDMIELHLSGNGKPQKGLLFRVADIEKVQGSILRWVRLIGGCVGTCALALVAAVVRYWMNGGG